MPISMPLGIVVQLPRSQTYATSPDRPASQFQVCYPRISNGCCGMLEQVVVLQDHARFEGIRHVQDILQRQPCHLVEVLKDLNISTPLSPPDEAACAPASQLDFHFFRRV